MLFRILIKILVKFAILLAFISYTKFKK